MHDVKCDPQGRPIVCRTIGQSCCHCTIRPRLPSVLLIVYVHTEYGAFVACVVFVVVARGRGVWLTFIVAGVLVVQNGVAYRTHVQSETVLQ